jgi:hypothetical protein
MESMFHQDFSLVRLQRDGLADRLGARAATIGEDIHLSAQERDLSSSAGESLIAHELAHVVQQRRRVGSTHRSPMELEQEANAAAAGVATGRHMRVDGRPSRLGPTVQLSPKVVPPPLSGNVLYVGMNNADPEIKALAARYGPAGPVKVKAIKATAEEAATSIGGASTFDLTTTAGVDALAKALTSDASKQAALTALFNGLSPSDRDDLAHVAKVYSDTEADGNDRMTRVVLSGHSIGGQVFGGSGWLSFDSLVKLGGIFPKAANQTKHLIVAGCHTGDESTILTYYVKAYPSLLTVWAWWGVCPTGPGAASAITTWASMTEHGETKIPAQGGGIATWSGGKYEGDPSGAAPASTMLTSIRSDDARFTDYVDGTRADPSPHGGWLEAYYARVFTASRRADITGTDHDEMEQKRHRALLLRFWKNVAKHFWADKGTVIARGYGTASVPDFAKLSRKDTLQAIKDFSTVSTASDPEKSAAAALLTALRDLDPGTVPDRFASD